MEEKNLTEEESLKIITDMIAKAKYHFHESGTSALLWGSTITICGLVSFSEAYWNWYIGFDIWLLPLIAIIPQIYISIKEGKNRKVVTHKETALNAIWTVYAISIFGLIFYINVVPGVTDKFYADEGIKLLKNSSGISAPYHSIVPGSASLFLLLYAMPTLATGLVHKFKPMIFGAVLCYIFFIVSCYISTTFDLLLTGLAGMFNWLIPGFILRRRFFLQKRTMNV
jgi:hypothetical protein